MGYDVATVAEEVSEYNWYNTSKADGGSGICQVSKVTACLRPLNPATGWTSYILPGQVKIVFSALLSNDPGRSSCTSPTWPVTGWVTR